MTNTIIEQNIKKVFKENMLLWASKQKDKPEYARTIHELTTFIIQSDFAADLAMLITSQTIDTALPDLEDPSADDAILADDEKGSE